MTELKQFRFWCQSVLPVVYDESLSYYEVLCRCVDYINKLIETDKTIFEDIDELQKELNEVKKIVENFDYDFAERVIKSYISTSIFFGLTDSGYFVAYIPGSWDDIHFGTTGYDTESALMPEYGHLCLDY